MTPSLLDAVVSEAGRRIDEPIEAGWPYVTASGTLLVFTRSHVLRIAIGPGRHHLERHRAALVGLATLEPPPVVAGRLPRWWRAVTWVSPTGCSRSASRGRRRM